MKETNESIGRILTEARKNAAAGNYEKAVDLYEYFFNHALDENDGSYYGVRLSYCLAEWAEIGTSFPPATVRLNELKNQSLGSFLSESSPERFHEYMAICRYISDRSEPVEKFVEIFNADKAKADLIVRFIWDDLVDSKLWNICKCYVEKPEENYASIIRKLDAMRETYEKDKEFFGDRFVTSMNKSFIKSVTNLLNILRHCDQPIALDTIASRIESDLADRKLMNLMDVIREKAAI